MIDICLVGASGKMGIVLATSGLVNTIFIVWILIRLIQGNQKKAGFTNYTQNHKVKKD